MTKNHQFIHRHAHRPEGSYPHPDGGYIVECTHVTKNGRRLKIIAHHKVEPDTKAIAKALIELAEQLRRRDNDKGS
ncbi:MAG: hypothetical protein GY788_03580 [bacterium]|nr:hypothetical protein [bacterium]